MVFAANSPAVTEAGTNSLFRLRGRSSGQPARLWRDAYHRRGHLGSGRLIVVTPSKFCDAPSNSAPTSSTRPTPMDQRQASC